MTTKERKKILKDEAIKNYERLKYKTATTHLRGEISDDDYRMRKKFIVREENLRLVEIDQMTPKEAKKSYEDLMKKLSPDE